MRLKNDSESGTACPDRVCACVHVQYTTHAQRRGCCAYRTNAQPPYDERALSAPSRSVDVRSPRRNPDATRDAASSYTRTDSAARGRLAVRVGQEVTVSASTACGFAIRCPSRSHIRCILSLVSTDANLGAAVDSRDPRSTCHPSTVSTGPAARTDHTFLFQASYSRAK